MIKDLVYSKNLKSYFDSMGYDCRKPHPIVNNKDTVFVTAGIQSVLSDYRNSNLNNMEKIYISQPVIRTQFANSICEGSSIAFINSTTAGFNISEEKHDSLIKDWMDMFQELGMNLNSFSKRDKEYERQWGDLLVSGKKTFYYYNNIELGDTTFFSKVICNDGNIGIDSMSDIGFGLERVRWCLKENNSYFNLYSDTSTISPEIKAYLSAIALLFVNDVKPSNKNSGYRIRKFSKELVKILDGRDLSDFEEEYLLECIDYWKDWQEVNKNIDFDSIKKEYVRNCNRYIIDKLLDEGYENLSGININISKDEFAKRLISSGVNSTRVKKIIK